MLLCAEQEIEGKRVSLTAEPGPAKVHPSCGQEAPWRAGEAGGGGGAGGVWRRGVLWVV